MHTYTIDIQRWCNRAGDVRYRAVLVHQASGNRYYSFCLTPDYDDPRPYFLASDSARYSAYRARYYESYVDAVEAAALTRHRWYKDEWYRCDGT